MGQGKYLHCMKGSGQKGHWKVLVDCIIKYYIFFNSACHKKKIVDLLETL